MRRTLRAKNVKPKNKVDRLLLGLVLAITLLGLVAVADASAPQALKYFGDELFFFKQQAVWALAGVVLLVISSFIHYSLWEKLATPLFGLSLLLLIVVLIPGVGLSALGARRWIVIGGFSFQPSEMVKFTLALYLAKVAGKDKKPLAYFIPLGIVAFLIMLQPDLGTTLVVVTIAMIQIFASGVNILYLIGGGLSAGVLAILLILTSEYRRARLTTFLQSTSDPLGEAYHIKQVLLALGSGGIFGVGLGHSRQKYLFLPEAATDSIFAVIAEELGFIGALFLIGLFIFLIRRGIKIAEHAPDKFSQILAVGIVAWIGGQIFLNIASMVALVPLTGIPLPFISYGGTSLTAVLFAAGILLNISRYASSQKE